MAQTNQNTDYTGILATGLGKPIAQQGLNEILNILGLSPTGASLEGLGGGLLSSLGSMLPALFGSQGNPALNWMGSQAGSLGSQALLGTGVFSPAYQAISGWGSAVPSIGAEAFSTGAQTMGEAGSNMLAAGTGGLGSILTQVAPLLPLLQMVGGGVETDWTNPYAGYASNIPIIGGVLGSVIEILGGKDKKQQHKIEQAFQPIRENSQKRLKALRDAGYTDWDIYNYAQANNLLAEYDDSLHNWGYGGGSTIGALYTPEEATAKAKIKGADKDTGASGWQYVPGKGWTTGGGTWEATNESAPPEGWFDPTYQQEVPTLAHPEQLLGNPNRQITLGSDDYTPYFTPGEQYDYGISESWGSPAAYAPSTITPFDPTNTNNAKIWDNYYIGDRIAAGGGHAMNVPEYLNTHPVALADWIQYHPGEDLPAGVTAETPVSQAQYLQPEANVNIPTAAKAVIPKPNLGILNSWGADTDIGKLTKLLSGL